MKTDRRWLIRRRFSVDLPYESESIYSNYGHNHWTQDFWFTSREGALVYLKPGDRLVEVEIVSAFRAGSPTDGKHLPLEKTSV